MLKSIRLRFRQITFFLESIFQSRKLIQNPRPINLVRACKFKDTRLAESIFWTKFNPIEVKFNVNYLSSDIDVVRWHAISPNRLAFDINMNASNEALEPTFRRIFDLSPLLKEFHSSEYFHGGWIDINLGDYAKTDGLAFCSNRKSQILIPDIDFIGTHGYDEMRSYFGSNPIPWEQKKEILFWRGSSTGISPSGSWRDLQRIKLCEIASNSKNQDLFDVGLSNIVQLNKSAENEIKTLGYLKDYKSIKLINTFKYLIDVDGNSNAWSSLFLKLLSGSVVLKVESEGKYKQWYYDRLIPWQHYVPVNRDLSDLHEKLDWLRDNDDKAKKLAKLGKDFAFDISFEKELANSLDLIKNNLVVPKAK